MNGGEREKEKEGDRENERRYLPFRLIKGSYSLSKIHLFALSSEGIIVITFAP